MGEPFDDTGYRGRYTPEPDGLDKRCIVCKAPPQVPCKNPITGRPRRNGVSCIGRRERSPVSPIQTPPVGSLERHSGGVTEHPSEERGRG